MPKLVLLPGMDGTGELFADFVAALTGRIEARVVRYPRDIAVSYTELLRLVEDATPKIESFVLVAESYSTPLAVQFATTSPANLVGLVLVAGFVASPVRGWRRLVVRLVAPVIFRLPLRGFAMRRWLIGGGASERLADRVKAAAGSVRPDVLTSRLREILACDVRADLRSVSVPMLYLQAGQDRLVDGRCLKQILEARADVVVEVIDGPHLLLQREPQRSAEVVARWVEKLGK